MKPFATYTPATGLRWQGLKRPSGRNRYRIVIKVDDLEVDLRTKESITVKELLPTVLFEMTGLINQKVTATDVSFQCYIWG